MTEWPIQEGTDSLNRARTFREYTVHSRWDVM